MGFSTIPSITPPAGGFGMQAFQQGNALTQQNLEIQKQRLANEIQAPYAQMAQPFANAALQEAQAKPKLTLGHANQANAQAGYLGSETGINQFKLNNPAFINPDAYGIMLAAQRMMNNGNGSNQLSNGGMAGNNNPMANVPARFAPYFMSPAQQAAMTAEASQNVDMYNQEQKASSNDSSSILNMIKDLDQFHQGYLNSKATGGYAGTIPSHGPQTLFGNWSPEQQADRASNKFVTDSGHEMGGRMTNMLLQNIKGSKIDRSLDPQAELNQYNYLRSNLVRALRSNDFITAARSQGMPWQHAYTSWKQFNEDMPAYDSANQTNLPNADFSSYIGQEASNSLSQGKRINPKAESSLTIAPAITKGKSKIARVQSPDGSILTAPIKDAQRLVKDHPDHKIIG